MAKDPLLDNALAPVPGALTDYLQTMSELTDDPDMPEVVAHEYSPLIDSSDMGPGDWAVLAQDIGENYYHFDGLLDYKPSSKLLSITCGKKKIYKFAALKVSPWLKSPVSKPLRNHRIRCSELPWVKDSGTTYPRERF